MSAKENPSRVAMGDTCEVATHLGWSSWSLVKRVPSTSERIRWMSSARGRALEFVDPLGGEPEGVARGVSWGVGPLEVLSVGDMMAGEV